jgi:hypothetical protein
MYRCEATSVDGFIQQLAVSYITNGYWFYVAGTIPEQKDPRTVDQKLIRQYGIDISKWTRCRQRKSGRASVQYLRYNRFFVLVATGGEHEFFEAEQGNIRDFRRHPLHFAGYTIAGRRFQQRWHAAVRLSRDSFHQLKSRFIAVALNPDLDRLERELRALPIEPYAAVRRQLFKVLFAVNEVRCSAGLSPISISSLRLCRRNVVAVR